MKTLLALIISLCMLVGLQAQDYGQAGQLELGGTLGLSVTTDIIDGTAAKESTTLISLEPTLGFFVADHMQFGIVPLYQRQSFEESSMTSWAIFFAPSYVFQLEGRVYPYITGYFGHNETTFKLDENELTLSGLSYGLGTGIKILIHKNECREDGYIGRALLNIGTQYLFFNLHPEDYDGDRMGFNQFQIVVGFSVFFD